MRDWLKSFASMKNLSFVGRWRGRSACASGGQLVEALESRVMLSAAPTGWRGSIGLEHTVDRLHSKIGYAGITAAASGDLAFFTGRAVGGKATDKVAIY